MFVLSTPEQSDALHQELIDIEIGMFSELGLHFKVCRGHCNELASRCRLSVISSV